MPPIRVRLKNFVAVPTIIWLYFRHLLTLTSLEVKDVQVVRERIAGRTRTRILWRTQGCHRISIKRYREQPGTIKGISILEGNNPQILRIKFHGYHGVKVIFFEIPSTDIQFFRQFSCRLDTWEAPRLSEIHPVEFLLQPAVQAVTGNVELLPVDFLLELQSLAPDHNQ